MTNFYGRMLALLITASLVFGSLGSGSTIAGDDDNEELMKKLVEVMLKNEKARAEREKEFQKQLLELQKQNLELVKRVNEMRDGEKNTIKDTSDKESTTAEKAIVDLQKQNIELLKMIHKIDAEKKVQDELLKQKLAELEAEKQENQKTIIVEKPVEVVKVYERPKVYIPPVTFFRNNYCNKKPFGFSLNLNFGSKKRYTRPIHRPRHHPRRR